MKKNKHIVYLLLIAAGILFCAGMLNAQPYFFRHYQVENGLSNNTVYCSVQDNNGFLWFGTKDGLNRFDGYHFKLFNVKDHTGAMAADAIWSLLVDKRNVLWVGCPQGIYTFDTQKELLVRFNAELRDVNSIQNDRAGQLWFLSGFTVCRYNFDTKVLQKFPPEKYFAATTLCQSEEGDIWAGTPNGLIYKFDNTAQTFKSFNVFSHSPAAASTWIQRLYPAGKGSLFIGTSSQGLKHFNMQTCKYTDVLTYNPDKTSIYIRDIKKYAENEFWFATESGIFILNTLTNKFINLKKNFVDPYSLSDNAVYSLCKDKEGGMWAGTYFGGVNYYSKQYAVFQKYFPDNSKNSLSGSDVREICKDNQGNIWIGTEDAGLNKLNPKTGAITHFKPTGEGGSIAYSNIHGLLVVGNDLWIGTFEHGLDVMDTRTGKVKSHYMAGPGKKQLKSNFIVSLFQNSSGKIFIGCGNSLYQYDKMSDGFDPVTEVPQNLFVSCLLEDNAKTIWVGTHERGIYYFNPVTKKSGHFENDPINKNTLSTNSVNAVYEDGKQNLWFATEGGGLSKLSRDRKVFSSFTIKDGLPSNFIFKVLEDNKKQLWLSSSRGLVKFNPETRQINVYTKDNGLLSDQFNYNSGYKDEDDKMYFGCQKGMITFNPSDFLTTSAIPPVYITGFQVQNKELDISTDSAVLPKSIIYTDKMTLPYNRSSFSIDFAALSFISPEMTTYSYFMKGIDKEWTQIKPNRKIYFTNLSPGNYLFKLKAGINGNWSKETLLSINILPPFWATTFAWLVYAALTIGLCWYLFRTYHIIVEDKKEKEIYEAKLDFFTNVAHEIRTPLTLIKTPVENLLEQVNELPGIKEDVIMMERNTNRLITLVTQILDFRQTETKGFSIDFVKLNITELMKDAYLNFSSLAKKKNIVFNMQLPKTDVYALADEEALNKIFSNLFNNALKYCETKVNIRMPEPEKDGRNFIIEFENDGTRIPPEMKQKIFEPFFRLKDSLKQQGTGIGLALARSLAELHAGSLHLKDTSEGLNVFVLCLPFKPAQNNKENLKKNKRLL